MKSFSLLALGAALLIGGAKLTTKYDKERALQIERELTLSMETTTMEREVNGEPQESQGGASKSRTVHASKTVDQVLEIKDGAPTKVRRKFESVGGTSSRTMGEESSESEIESGFDGITLEITVGEDGTSEARVVSGKEPEAEGVLEGHAADVFLDAFLSAKEVDVDATWDLDKAAITRGLGLADDAKMFKRAPRPQGEGGGGGGGGGGRPRGGFGGGASELSLLSDGEWKGTAKVTALDKVIGGETCAVIELKLEASGEREMQMLSGGGRRGGAFEPLVAAAFANTTKYEANLEGSLYFSIKGNRPVKLEIEGSVRTESTFEMERGENKMKTHTIREGKLTYAIDVEEAAIEKEEKQEEKGGK